MLRILIALAATAIAAPAPAPAQSPYHSILGASPDDSMGSAAARVGDRLAVGVDRGFGTGIGEVQIRDLQTLLVTHTIPGTTPDGRFGWAIEPAGDIDGDGREDILTGSDRRTGSGGQSNLGAAELLRADVRRATNYGSGCLGFAGRTPQLSAAAVPALGNRDFAFVVQEGRPSVPAAILMGIQSGSLPLRGGCAILVAPAVALDTLPLTGSGAQRFPLPIPTLPDLAGQHVYFQAAVFDGTYAGLFGIATTPGLDVVLGG